MEALITQDKNVDLLPIKENGVVFCSYKVSQLASQLGYTAICIAGYNRFRRQRLKAIKGAVTEAFSGFIPYSGCCYEEDCFQTEKYSSLDTGGIIPAPTQASLLDWLATKDMFPHVSLTTYRDNSDGRNLFCKLWNSLVTTNYIDKRLVGNSHVRENALEIAICVALNELNDRQ